MLFAGAAAGIHGRPVPFTGQAAAPLGIGSSEHPVAVLHALWQWLLATPALGLEAAILAIAAASLPLVARGSDLTIASFASLFLAATLVAAPEVSALPLVLCGWVVYVALTVLSRRIPERTAQRHTFGALAKQTCARFLDMVKPVGGPRRPRPQQRFRGAGAG